MLKAPWVGCGHGTYISKGVTERFDVDAVRISQIQTVCQNKATGTPLGMFIYTLTGYWRKPPWPCRVKYILIGVGLSALLVSTIRAMRRPLQRGTGLRLAPRFSCVCTRAYLRGLSSWGRLMGRVFLIQYIL